MASSTNSKAASLVISSVTCSWVGWGQLYAFCKAPTEKWQSLESWKWLGVDYQPRKWHGSNMNCLHVWSRRQGRLDGIHWVDHNILDLTNQDVAKHPCRKRSRMRADKKLMDLMLGVLEISCVHIFIQNWTNVAPLGGALPDSKSSKPGQLMAKKKRRPFLPLHNRFLSTALHCCSLEETRIDVPR